MSITLRYNTGLTETYDSLDDVIKNTKDEFYRDDIKEALYIFNIVIDDSEGYPINLVEFYDLVNTYDKRIWLNNLSPILDKNYIVDNLNEIIISDDENILFSVEYEYIQVTNISKTILNFISNKFSDYSKFRIL